LALKELKVGEVADEPRESIYLLDSLQISQFRSNLSRLVFDVFKSILPIEKEKQGCYIYV